MELQALRALLQEKGIVGAGGAGFPTYAKLSEKADTIVLNCAECEPLLKLHQQLLEQHAPEILSTITIVATAMGVENVIIGVKREYESTVQAVKEQLSGYPNIKLCLLDSVYPTGDEVVLIYETTGRVVRPGGLPIEAGVVVFNAETMYNTYCAIDHQKPVVDKRITITGEVANPISVKVPLGMTMEEVVALAGGVTVKDPVYLIGGSMMGRIGSAKQPVTKTTNAIIVLPSEHNLVLSRTASSSIQLKRAASICCQCQSCTDLCSRHALGHPIEPHLFMRAAANRDFSNQEVFINTMFCSGCGICELYACPQSLSPRSLIATYKAGLRQAGVKVPTDVVAADVAESRQYRLIPEQRLEARIGLGKYKQEAVCCKVQAKPERVKLLFSQHIGAPAVPIVAKGDVVKAGDLLAKQGDGLSVPVHASIDGTVLDVTPQFAIIIKN
ncbi:MAG: SLBB domain-containing protein [Faecalibacterium sp.]